MNGNINKYPTYKPSNIDWIGEIPSHWLLVKTGHYTYIVRGASPRPAGEPSLFDGDFIHWITVKEVTNGLGKFVTSTETYLTEEGMKQSRVVEPETLVISNSGATLGVPKILKIKGCINDGSVAFLNLKENLFRDFLYYFIFSQTELLREQQSGYGQPNLNTDIIANIKFPLPPLQEQQAIVAYLDEKTTLIDELIAKKERKIELLKEQRAALINHAVTKGLNAEVAFKDSGIEWIGEIPEHWEAKLLKYAADKIDELPESTELLFAVENIESHTGKLVGLEKALEYEGAIAGFKKGDTIFNKLRPYLAKVYYAECSGGYFGELLTIRGKKEIFPKYLYHILSSRGFLEIVNSSSEGTKMPRANWETSIKLIGIPIPPLSEQQAIVTYLDEQTALIDKNIELESQKIEKLKEYRQSLISNVVTGKIKVV